MGTALRNYARFSLITAFALITTLILTGCGDDQEEAARTEAGKRNVRVSSAERKDLRAGISLTGRIEADKHLNISSAVGGRIEKIHVQVGDTVAEGDLLVEFDDSQLVQAQKSYENIKRNYQRISRLYEADAVDRQSYEEVETAYGIAESNYNHLLKNIKLRSPINGRISSITMKEGENFTPMGLPHLVRIVSSEKMKAVVNLPDSDYHSVITGMPVELKVTAYPDETFHGVVSYISPEADMMAGTFKCEITIRDSADKLRHNQFARIFIVTDEAQQTLVIPQQALINENRVFVVENGKAQKREIETGIYSQKYIEITSGIQENEQVIVVGNIGLADMSPVNIIE